MPGAGARVTRDVTARGVRMRVLEAGDERAESVVLLHDFLAGHLEFEDVIDPLAERFRVIAPDLPGSGQSEKPTPSRYPYGVEAFAEAVADLISAYQAGPANVVGHGLGGAVAITLAASHSELVSRLVLVAPRCYQAPAGLGFRVALWPLLGGVLFKQLFGRTVFRSYFKDRVFSADAAVPFPRIDRFYGDFNAPSARESAHAVLRALQDTRATAARISRIRQPTLVAWGRDDRVSPAGFAIRLSRELPDARLELFDAGHSPHEERPDEFVNVVREFCEGRR